MGPVNLKSKIPGLVKRSGAGKNQKPKIFILHGWAYSTEKWAPFLKLLEKNKIPYEMPQIPGLTAPLSKVWTLNDYVIWLAQETKNQKPITILGHSNGGRIALAFALKHPDRLESLILIDSAGILDKGLALKAKKYILGTLAKTAKRLSGVRVFSKILYKLARETDYRKATENMRETMKNLISVDLELELPKIAVQTLIIWGENDAVTPLWMGRTMERTIKDSKLSIIKEAKHSPQFTHPQQVADNIISF